MYPKSSIYLQPKVINNEDHNPHIDLFYNKLYSFFLRDS